MKTSKTKSIKLRASLRKSIIDMTNELETMILSLTDESHNLKMINEYQKLIIELEKNI